MGISIGKVFSILVASENGQKCNSFRADLRKNLLEFDEATGIPRIILFKEGRKDSSLSDDWARVAKEIGKIAKETLANVPEYFYGPDYNRNISKLN